MSYKILAKFYDRLMSGYNYEKMSEYIINNVKGRRGLDIGCGSGRITINLALSGLNMIGIDKSNDMLNVASSNARAKGAKIIFAEGDADALVLSKSYDFIVATCDVINYINPININNFIKTVYNYLNPNGIFILDISSEYKLINIIGNNVFYEDYDDLTYIWDNHINDNSIDMDMVFFTLEKNNYIRNDEHHTQYIYKTDVLINLLKETGFNISEILDGENFKSITETSNRILIKAEKN